MAVKAACDVISSLISTEAITNMTVLIPTLMTLLSSALSNDDDVIAIRIFTLFDDCTVSDEPFVEQYLQSVVEACCEVGIEREITRLLLLLVDY